MGTKTSVTIDGNEAAAYVAFRTSEVIAIYPITPSSTMGELSDQWAAQKRKNIWGTIPLVVEMQSEGGAAGAAHGSLQTGAMTTTFTASQGLLLMIPNMYKIAGELTSTVFHVSARALAAQALSIFGDHSDVMACRQTGWAILFGNNVQEVMDMAMVSTMATLKGRVPFINTFDGFRTSHEVSKITPIPEEVVRELVSEDLVREHRERGLDPNRPVVRGTAQNPDVYFQGRESSNLYYEKIPGIVQEAMNELGAKTGRQYHLFDYVGAKDADRIVILMGSGAEAAHECIDALTAAGEKVGVLKVRLFRPFSARHFVDALPKTVKSIAVLDRTKEPGSAGEPLYQDVLTALGEAVNEGTLTSLPKVLGGRYGLSSKEFTPAMVKAVLDELKKPTPKNHFTVGIIDDVSHTSLTVDPHFSTEPSDVTRAVFWGLGSDGTVGANKNSIKIIGEGTPLFAQGYFVYDSKKSGSITTSHLRFGPRPIRSTYLVQTANFIACHQSGLLTRYPVLEAAAVGATFLLNSSYGPDEVWNHLPREVQKTIIDKKLKFYVLDGYKVAKAARMGARINTIMQTAFFALSGVLPKDEAIEKIRYTIKKTYGSRGEAVVQQNFAAVDSALAYLFEVKYPDHVTSTEELRAPVSKDAPDFVQQVTAELIAGRGDLLPVSKMPVDGTYPTATTQWEKREISVDAPVWESDLCIQCGKCVLVCPHAVIRAKIVDSSQLQGAPEGFLAVKAKAFREVDGDPRYTLQVSQADCTGCALCVEVCPAKDKTNPSRKALNMKPIEGMTPTEKGDFDYFLKLDDRPKQKEPINFTTVKNVQLLQPRFEFSGACSGCGETPYVRLLTQLFGDRAIIANATGCSSIYGGNLPTTPYSVDKAGRGPAWNNSLFEDNAEFGLGYRLALDARMTRVRQLLEGLNGHIPEDLKQALTTRAVDVHGADKKRAAVMQLRGLLESSGTKEAKQLIELADTFVDKSVWILGGDGWAYDIGYGGLDHVLASGFKVNVLVLDTEVYSNTGGQASKSTSRGAVAKFAAGGKPSRKKDLGRMIMSYGNVYVASISMGANDQHAVKAFAEAEAWDGPSLILAYSHCIAHGIDMQKGLNQQKMAVDSGYWPLYRYNPALAAEGKNPFSFDSKEPTLALKDYIYTETRYRMLQQSDPQAAAALLELAQVDVRERFAALQKMAQGV